MPEQAKRRNRRGKRGGAKHRNGGSSSAIPSEAFKAAMTLSRMFPEDDPEQILATCLSVPNPSEIVGKFAGGGMDPFGVISPHGVGGSNYVTRNTTRHTSTTLLDAYAKSPWLRAVQGRVATSFAQTNWRVCAVKKNGRYVRQRTLQSAPFDTHHFEIKRAKDRGELVELDDHPLVSLLAGEGTMFVGLTLRQLTQIYLDIAGEAFWVLRKNEFGMPYQALPIPPHWVDVPADAGNPYYGIRMPTKSFQIPAEYVIRFHDPDPLDPFGRGLGVGVATADNLDIDLFSSKHITSHFLNRARPDVIVSADGLSPASTDRLERRWLQSSQGFMRAYAPFFLSRKVDIKELSQSFESMQLTDLRRSSRDAVQQVYGIPPELLGIVESANRSTIGAAETIFARWTLVPRLEFMRQHLQAQLAPMYDERLIITYDNPVLEDNEFHLRAAQAMPDTLKVNEWRRMQGQEPDPSEFGDSYLINNRRVPHEDPLEPDEEEPDDEDGPEEQPDDEDLSFENSVVAEVMDILSRKKKNT